MIRSVSFVALCLAWGCGAVPELSPTPPQVEPAAVLAEPAPPPERDPSLIRWSVLRSEIEASICIRTVELPDGQSMLAPSYGRRKVCGLGPADTPVGQAVVTGFETAEPTLISLRAERNAAFSAAKLDDEGLRLAAVRQAYMTEAFLGVLLPRVYDALRVEGLRCDGCPEPVHPPVREVTWERVRASGDARDRCMPTSRSKARATRRRCDRGGLVGCRIRPCDSLSRSATNRVRSTASGSSWSSDPRIAIAEAEVISLAPPKSWRSQIRWARGLHLHCPVPGNRHRPAPFAPTVDPDQDVRVTSVSHRRWTQLDSRDPRCDFETSQVHP